MFCSWNIQPRRCLNDWEIEEIERLFGLLDSYPLGEIGLPDEMKWRGDEDKGFSVRSMYEELNLSKRTLFPVECVWKVHIKTKAAPLL